MSLGSLVRRKFVGCLACVCLLIAVGLGLTGQGVSQPTQRSSYDVFSQLPFGLPMSQVAPTPEHYQPVADWVGRLILPQQREVQAQPGDWVWFEVLHAPIGGWVGKTMTLTWQTTPALDSYVSLVARDITFRDETEISQQQGNVHPARLDGWRQVGPLQSLAGARPHDDVLVALSGVQFRGGETLTIDQPPTQIAERFYGLVKFDASVPGDTACQSTCQGFRVRHYRPETRQFDGASETVYLPELPAINGLQQFSFAQIENSPAGEAGWYIYGSPNARGQFVVRAIAPRALFELQARQTITDRDAGLNYINFGNWRKTRDRKGTLNTVQLGKPDWQEGDQGLVLHIFGGIGGEQGEPPPIVATVTGHFSYGIATVVRDRLTQDLRFDIDYHQIYAHNPNGIVAGKLSWAEYMGNLQRGWLGTRPVSDVIIKLEALTETYRGKPVEAQASAQPGKEPVTFSINPLAMLQQQLQIMAARYRTGDGTGAAVVTPAQSCIQDSSQALYETIQLIEAQIRGLPTANRSLWLSPEMAQQFKRLVALGQNLEDTLVPVGIVRSDWQQNSEVLAGIRNQSLTNQTSLTTQLLSWRTVIPRVAYDQLATIFFKQGASLRFLRTNQVGGLDPTIVPLAPTELFGQYFFVPTAFSRLIESLRIPQAREWGLTLAVGVGYGAIAVPLGLKGRLLSVQSILGKVSTGRLIIRLLRILIFPALLEEAIFRVLLLPHFTERVLPSTFVLWATLSLVLFVLSHPVQAAIFRNRLFPLFSQPLFMGLTALLGLSCTLVYAQTGSLWTVTVLHSLVVIVWLVFLKGWYKLGGKISG